MMSYHDDVDAKLKQATYNTCAQQSMGEACNPEAKAWTSYSQQETSTPHPISKLYQRRDELQKQIAEIDYLLAQAEQPDVRKVLDLLHRVENI